MKLDKELLKDLYMIDHGSKNEYKMMNFIINYTRNIPNVTVEFDHYYNLFVTKNTNNPDTYPCLIAHTDQIVTNKGPYRVVELDGIMSGAHNSDNSPCSLGCDDANGIYVVLHSLNVIPDLKVIFTVEEEIGANGAREVAFNADFLVDCRYFLQADRRGNSDMITHTNMIDVVTPEFLAELKPFMDKYGYKENDGTFTDVGEIVRACGICGVNISCGYYKEHTSNEYCNLNDLEKCLNLVHDLVVGLPAKQFDIKIQKSYYYYGGYGCYYDPAEDPYGLYANPYYDEYYDGTKWRKQILYEPDPESMDDYDRYIAACESPSEFDVKKPKKIWDYQNDIPCDYCKDMDCMHCKAFDEYY